MSALQGHWREVSEQRLPTAITKATYLSEAARTSSQLVIIVERKEDWASYFPSEDIVSAQEYLEQTRGSEQGKRVQVINLCRSYKYLGHGYYCSLLAEARGHKVIPSVRTISELTRKSLYGLSLDDLDKALDKALNNHLYSDTEGFTLTLYFGKTNIEPLQDLARQLFEVFPCPILLVEFRRRNGWHIEGVKFGALHKLREDQEDHFANALDNFSRKIWRMPRSRRLARYDLAILHDPQEALPPSNARALENFVRVGKGLGIDVELIERKDYARIAEYDGLLIRETTSVDNHTYRFAKKAESEGLVVMDDPASILRCTNKVYLTDLLNSHQLGMPATEILYKERPQDFERVGERLGFPLVLKIPDGCFSRGVIKVESQQALLEATAELFEHSVLLLAQEFFYTEYDWRIGVLNRKPIFACQYFMSKGHWQIYNHKAKGQDINGECRTLAVHEAPKAVVDLAVKTANLIGDGLYGVDLKQSGDKVVVIEVNDNPNIDAGIEDAYLQDDLYSLVLEEFVRRLELKRRGQVW
ncbi:30S ribosomal protein S6--L-glutamate ligase [Pseudomonas sp. FW306-02-F02-AA]|uniref:Carboxylate--amine ligase n=1 Tax=Pseudomonas fluorescens TaxID=294 RepID=A0A0N9WPJ3_PSEFL|nr:MULTISPECIES: RimK family protein [Pseudomonas]ALI04344.1 carboxylate--amine ligase [Pseudomonas fluorescens]PMZ01638.1 30S ribosomal protein S6--L-glutamate ligase [Pseudomonas sp. FW306-02-F02-AB]PMZ10151.1 30S ribosomal protein S6--L-glutamate ligase [Pseudomonas sp. FW306-02-H06C]PMZ13210.1 30S ribosomal protein S6--L-glutamate ligase [Pseudomonas sp. FW306-02-F02-AA]PMZ19254.1 30S ribosomal protein S6--L-glutamate ligase [Pseudomonas sp. FW306-02-F08-AA]